MSKKFFKLLDCILIITLLNSFKNMQVFVLAIIVVVTINCIYLKCPKKEKLNKWYACVQKGSDTYLLYFIPPIYLLYKIDASTLLEYRNSAIKNIRQRNLKSEIFGESVTLSRVNEEALGVRKVSEIKKYSSLKGIWTIIVSINLIILNLNNILNLSISFKIYNVIIKNKIIRYEYY